MEELNEAYWTERYQTSNTPWDIGRPSRPLQTIADTLTEPTLRILIPGAGYGHEWAYLIQKGFTDTWLLEWSPVVLDAVRERFPDLPHDKLLAQDFFKHEGQYDVVLEQTFFCALSPSMRPAYVEHMARLLKPGGVLTGVLFDFPLTEQGPPYGGSEAEYVELFSPFFLLENLERCLWSEPARQGKELFIRAVRR